MTPQERAKHVDPSMLLPSGMTCGDCRWFRKCTGFLGSRFSADNIHCDWAPSAFQYKRPALQPSAPAEGEE